MKKNRYGLLAMTAGIALTAIGILRGQPAQVMVKAIRICMECVGIG